MLGTGLLQGLAVTAKNLVGSFHEGKRYTTVEYPEQKTKIPENYRNFPFLISENATDPMGTLRCVACQICEKECPPQCIYIEKSKDKKPDATGKMQIYPAIFDIDTSVCMSCQICVEVCPFDAIKMDQVYEIATTDRFTALLLDREQLAKANTYYHEIHPTEAAEVDARLAAERKAAEEKAKAAAAAAAVKAAAPKPAPAAPPNGSTPQAAAASHAAKPTGETRRVAPPPAENASAPVETRPVPTSKLPAAPSAEAPKPPLPAA
jgi:NADH-quinone oxidoreductase subunit I